MEQAGRVRLLQDRDEGDGGDAQEPAQCLGTAPVVQQGHAAQQLTAEAGAAGEGVPDVESGLFRSAGGDQFGHDSPYTRAGCQAPAAGAGDRPTVVVTSAPSAMAPLNTPTNSEDAASRASGEASRIQVCVLTETPP